MSSDERKVRFDHHNIVIGKKASGELIDVLVTVPCEDGAQAFARLLIESPTRVQRADGEYSYDMNVTTTHEVKRLKRSDGPSQTVQRDGLVWELPKDAPESMTSLLLHEKKVSEFLLNRFRPGAVFVDVGANVGAYSLRAAAKGMAVFAFEPNPENFRLLKSNAEANGLSLDLNQVALGDSESTGRLVLNGALSRLGSEFGVEVPIRTLDGFALSAADLLKVDVEGYELEVIRGARDTLRKYHPDTMVEMHDWAGADKEAALLGILTELGYKLEYIDRYPRGRHLSALYPR